MASSNEFGKILKVKDWLHNNDEVTKLENQIRKVIDDTILQALTKTEKKKVLNNSEFTAMVKNEIDSFLKEKVI